MLTTAIFVALGLLAAGLALFYKPKFALAAAIPFTFAAYFAFATEMNNQLGYSAEVGIVKKTEAMFISGFQAEDKIYFTVMELGKTMPRLVQFPASEQMQKALQELSKDDATVSKKIRIGKDGLLEALQGITTEGAGSGESENSQNRNGLGGWTTVDSGIGGLELKMDENWLPPKQK